MKEGWEYKKLKDVVDELFAGGDVPKPNVSKEKTEEYSIPIYTNGVEKDGLYGYTNKARVESPAVTISARGTIGATFRRNQPFFPAIRLIVIVPKCEILNFDFLFYYLQTITISNTGTSIPQLTVPNVKNSIIPVPPLSEQQENVDYLDSSFAKIDAMKANAVKSLNEAKALFQASLKQLLEPKEGWEEYRIEDICLIKSGNSSSNNSPKGDLPYIKVADMSLPSNELYINIANSYVDRDCNKKFIIPMGAVIFPKRGGAIYTNKKRIAGKDICCDLNIMGVIPSEKIIPLFLYYYFVNIDFKDLCNGAAIPQLNNCDIYPLVIYLPSLEVQNTLCCNLSELQSKVDQLQTNCDKISKECDALKQAILKQVFE